MILAVSSNLCIQTHFLLTVILRPISSGHEESLQQENLQDKLQDKEDARKDFLKANAKLKKNKEKYQQLHDKGKLSPKDEDEWAEKLKELQEEKDKAEQTFNKL